MMGTKGREQLEWDEPMPKTGKTLVEEATELKASGISWREVAEQMSETHGIKLQGGTVASMVRYYADPERRRKPKKKLRWDRVYDDSAVSLRDEVLELREAGESYRTISGLLMERHKLDIAPSTIAKMVGRMEGRPAAAATAAASGERRATATDSAPAARSSKPAAEADAKAERIREADVYPKDPFAGGGEEEERGVRRAGQATGPSIRQPGNRAPVVVHVARDGMEVWITARDEREMRIKAAEVGNLVEMVARMGEGAAAEDVRRAGL